MADEKDGEGVSDEDVAAEWAATADDGEDVIAHATEQRLAIGWISFGILEDPPWGLTMPHQGMTDDEHSVLLAELDVAIAGLEVVTVWRRRLSNNQQGR